METTELAGDVVVFNHNCKHSAWGGGGRRRMFTMNLCERYPGAKLQQLEGYLEVINYHLIFSRLYGGCVMALKDWCRHRYLEGIAGFHVDRVYSEVMKAIAGPRRMVHLEQVMANDGHLKAIAREAAKADLARG